MTDDVLMVPTKEFNQLVQYYQEDITDNALSNKAGRLTAEHFPDSIAITNRDGLTKHIIQIGPLLSISTHDSKGKDEE